MTDEYKQAQTSGTDWRKRTDTKRFQTIHSAVSPQDQVRQIQAQITSVIEQMKTYQADLRSRGMGLPSGALDAVREASTALDKTLHDLTASAIELRQLRALAETTALFHSVQNLQSVLEQVMDTVIQLTGAERGFILLRDAAGELSFQIARGIDREQLTRDDMTVSRTIVNEVAATGVPVRTENARNDPRYSGQDSIVGYQLRSILAVPLKVHEQVIGVVYCDNRVLAGLFREHELILLTAFANQAAVAIQNANLFDDARDRLREVTALRDLMDGVFTSIASGLIVLDADDVITAFNPAAEAITGVRSVDAVGAGITAMLPGFGQQFAAQIAGARVGYTAVEEAGVLLDDGQQRIWNVHFSPLRDETAPNPYFFAVDTDVTGADSQPTRATSLGAVILLDDLTEQREREAQLAQVRQYLPPALVENLRSEDIASLGGVEREISCLFADVRGFTRFSQDLQPEDLMTIINQYLTVASDSIHLFEGMVDKYIGDAVTGLFNTQLNQHDDHALRAVRAALSMSYDVEALHEVLPHDQRLGFGIGIHTGLAVLGNVGSRDRREFSAIGDALDQARLLQENAQRGEVLLSAETWQLVGHFFECEAMPPRKTRGQADFTVMYRVTGVRRR